MYGFVSYNCVISHREHTKPQVTGRVKERHSTLPEQGGETKRRDAEEMNRG